jgi:hypothetical protein
VRWSPSECDPKILPTELRPYTYERKHGSQAEWIAGFRTYTSM